MEDPFILLHNRRPVSTTFHSNRDIDYILTYGINPQYIDLLPVDTLIKSDLFGMCLNINTKDLFQASYSELSNVPARKLTLKNVQAKQSYKSQVKKQLEIHNIWQQTMELQDKALKHIFTDEDERSLNELDHQITDILLQ
jgi:hypothetical protein